MWCGYCHTTIMYIIQQCTNNFSDIKCSFDHHSTLLGDEEEEAAAEQGLKRLTAEDLGDIGDLGDVGNDEELLEALSSSRKEKKKAKVKEADAEEGDDGELLEEVFASIANKKTHASRKGT